MAILKEKLGLIFNKNLRFLCLAKHKKRYTLCEVDFFF